MGFKVRSISNMPLDQIKAAYNTGTKANATNLTISIDLNSGWGDEVIEATPYGTAISTYAAPSELKVDDTIIYDARNDGSVIVGYSVGDFDDDGDLDILAALESKTPKPGEPPPDHYVLLDNLEIRRLLEVDYSKGQPELEQLFNSSKKPTHEKPILEVNLNDSGWDGYEEIKKTDINTAMMAGAKSELIVDSKPAYTAPPSKIITGFSVVQANSDQKLDVIVRLEPKQLSKGEEPKPEYLLLTNSTRTKK